MSEIKEYIYDQCVAYRLGVVLHNVNDAPAVLWDDGSCDYYENGVYISSDPACSAKAESTRMKISMVDPSIRQETHQKTEVPMTRQELMWESLRKFKKSLSSQMITPAVQSMLYNYSLAEHIMARRKP